MLTTWAVGLTALAACALWAVQPLPTLDLPEPAPAATNVADRAGGEKPDGFAVDAFAVQLWSSARPAEAVARPAPVRQPQLRLELIGITEENGERRAALYDTGRDRLLLLAHGERVQGHTVTRIADASVVLTNGSSKSELTLRRGRRR